MGYHLFLIMLGTASLFTMINILWMLSNMSEKCTSLDAISVQLTPENVGLDKVVVNDADRIPSTNIGNMIEEQKTKQYQKLINEANEKRENEKLKAMRREKQEKAKAIKAAKKTKATSRTEKEATKELNPFGLPKKRYSVAELNALISERKNRNKQVPQSFEDISPPVKKLPRRFIKIDRLLGPRKENHHRDIIGDVSFLLDFAIMGFPKCGTTSMMRYLSIPGSMTIPVENCELAGQSAYKLVKRLHVQMYRDVDDDVRKTTRRGLKCPELIYDLVEAVAPTKFGFRFNHREYFYKTKYIVGVRHPIRWFESFYNYRITEGHVMPETKDLIGKCGRRDPNFERTWGVCTGRSMFHYYLARFSKTAMKRSERKLMIHPLFDGGTGNLRLNQTLPEIPPLIKKFDTTIFLYDVQQLSDSNFTRTEQFGKDIAKFIGLRTEMKNTTVVKVMPEEHFHTANNTVGRGKIDICDEEHKEVRVVLREIGAKAAKWMLRYFLKSSDVYVSSENHLRNILAEWKHDPCE